MMRAADVLAQSLVNNGADRVFCVPGESYLSVIDAFYDYPAIEVIRVRHEGGGGLWRLPMPNIRARPGWNL